MVVDILLHTDRMNIKIDFDLDEDYIDSQSILNPNIHKDDYQVFQSTARDENGANTEQWDEDETEASGISLSNAFLPLQEDEDEIFGEFQKDSLSQSLAESADGQDDKNLIETQKRDFSVSADHHDLRSDINIQPLSKG